MLKRYEEYKKVDSNWINEIPTVWEWKKLKEVSSFISRGTTPNYAEKGVKVVNQATFSKGYWDIHDVRYTSTLLRNSKGFLKNDDILLASTGGGILGKVYHFKEKDEYIADSHVTIIRLRTNCNPKYFYYQFKIKYELINNVLAKGSTNQTELQRQWLRDFQLPIPSRPEQDKIVQYLDWKTSEMNRFIHQKKKQIKLLEKLKIVIINKTVFSGIHNAEKKETNCNWIPDIPKHWKLKKAKVLFKEVVDTGYGNELPLLSITNKDGVVLQSETGRKRRMSEDASGYKRIKPGDIGYNLMNAFIGSLGVSEYDGLISPAYAVCRPIVKMCSKYYQYVYRTPQFLQEFDNNSYGIMIERNRLYFDSFKQIMAPVPPYEEQIEIVEYLEKRLAEIDEMISSIQKEISLVEELKVKLVSDVVTGQVDVRDIKIPTYETETDNIESDDDSNEQIFDESIEE